MNADEIRKVLDTHLSKSPGYDAASAHRMADSLGSAMTAIAPAQKQPTPKQQQCYGTCAATRDVALAAAATKPWPVSAALAAAAIVAFNACRHQCDQTP